MSKKEAILSIAAKLFAEKGFKDTSMAEISKLTGAAEGTIFYHFKTKDDLLIAILEMVKTGIVQEFESYVGERSSSSGLEMIEDAIAFYLYMATKREEWFLLLNRYYIYELARVNETTRKHLEAIYTCFVDIFDKGITLGLEDQSIINSASRKTALIIFSMVHGLVWFKHHDLYDASALYHELITCCRHMLTRSTVV
ncbi:MAG: TetR/AcrR family transcriptional regulator [Desulfobacterales bacterium]|nr:TetR/AcrR family transcriptional regulator [Desulfobacterales bacterium]